MPQQSPVSVLVEVVEVVFLLLLGLLLLGLLQPLRLPLRLTPFLASIPSLPFALVVFCHLHPRRFTSRPTTRRSNKNSWEAQTWGAQGPETANRESLGATVF